MMECCPKCKQTGGRYQTAFCGDARCECHTPKNECCKRCCDNCDIPNCALYKKCMWEGCSCHTKSPETQTPCKKIMMTDGCEPDPSISFEMDCAAGCTKHKTCGTQTPPQSEGESANNFGRVAPIIPEKKSIYPCCFEAKLGGEECVIHGRPTPPSTGDKRSIEDIVRDFGKAFNYADFTSQSNKMAPHHPHHLPLHSHTRGRGTG